MPDTPSITTVKRFTYRGLPEEWSNTYHFTGTQPATDAAWKTLGEAIFALERTILPNSHQLVKLYGYNAGTEHSVYQHDYVALGETLLAGSVVIDSSVTAFPGDAAGWIRAKIGTSSKGKNVYIRKYYHGVFGNAGGGDALSNGWKTPAATLATNLLAGTLPGGVKWAGPQAQTATLPAVSNFVTTRTLKRRGKRPS